MLDSAGKPLVVELFVAFASCALVGEIVIPLHGEQGTCIIETKEVDDWHKRSCEYEAKWMNRKWFFPVDPCPLQQCVLKLFRIPTEFPLTKQVVGTRMMAIVPM